MSARRYLISYDIPSYQRRSQVHRLLTGWGVRVQLSAFECVLTRAEIARLQRQLNAQLDPDADHVVIWQCAKSGTPGHPMLGRASDSGSAYWLG